MFKNLNFKTFDFILNFKLKISNYFIVLLILIIFLHLAQTTFAFDYKRPNNKFGIHLAQPNSRDIKMASDLVNANGDWGYITLVIDENDRNKDKWQGIFDNLRELHLIPIIRLATRAEGENWRRPKPDDATSWANFLDSLNWVIKNRYIILFNEPNHGSEWGGEVDPIDYGQVAYEFAKKLKEKNPDFFVMLGGLDASAPSIPTGYEDEVVFLKKIINKDYGSKNLFDYIDGWSSHSYPADYIGSVYSSGRRSIKTYEWELELLKELGVKKDLPVFITETGWYNNLGNTQDLFEKAFNDVWLSDSRVVAVTPFVLNYQSQPFDVFSWVKLGENDFYPHYYRVQSLAKSKGNPEIIDRGQLKFDLSKELVIGSSYHFQVKLKNSGQAIWDKNNGYSMILDSDESYFFTDLRNIKPKEEATVDLYMKTPNLVKERELNLVLIKDKKEVLSKDWKFKILPRPSVQFSVNLYPKKKNLKEEYEIQFFDTREQLVFKKVIEIENQKGYLEGVQNISYGEKYRVVLLKPSYLPEQQYLVFNQGSNKLRFEMMYPIDFNEDGHFDLEDVWLFFRKPSMINLFMP